MDLLYEVLVYISLLVYLGLPLFWFVRHYFFLNYDMHRIELRVITYVVILLFDAAIFMIFSPYISNRYALPSYSAPLGWIFLLGWVILEGWSIALLVRSMKNVKKLETGLVKTGPYSIIRHPVYVAHVFFNFGAYLITGAVIPLMVFVMWVVLIKPLADLEDEELALRLGEKFHDYKKKVPQLLPKLR
ncbi:MAG: isoprenylcysteine carboxylmethyltransferase family protein [Candidatus ainarchaeum sp.]|nr:isoprenylcysteine carboxylmethyltransferase family protein [Candidatus ainarchaeum sp.]